MPGSYQHLYYVPEFNVLVVFDNYYGKKARWWRDSFGLPQGQAFEGKTDMVWIAMDRFGMGGQ